MRPLFPSTLAFGALLAIAQAHAQHATVLGPTTIGNGSANYMKLLGSSTGNFPSINALGSDPNIGITLIPQGSGSVVVSGNLSLPNLSAGTQITCLGLDVNNLVVLGNCGGGGGSGSVTWPTQGDLVISPGLVGNPTGISMGTGLSAALSIGIGNSGAVVLLDGAGGTPSSITLTHGVSLPIGGIGGLGTGIGTALAINTGTSGSFIILDSNAGTPTAINLTNGTALPIAGISGLGAGVGTAMAQSVNGANGLLTYSVIGTGGATLGLLNDDLTFTGNNNFSGSLTFSNLSSGTVVSCLGLTSSNLVASAACSSGGGAVASVTNSDGTLTISPTVGAITASLALNHSNTWVSAQTFNGGLAGTLTGHSTLDLALTGGTLTGELVTVASTSGTAGLSLPQGVAPNAPVNGNIWITSGGVFAQVAGSTVGPFGTAGSGAVTWPNAGDIVISPGAVGNPTGILPGTGVSAALSVSVGSAGAMVLLNGVGGIPTSLGLANATGLPIAGISGLGTGVGTALAINTGTSGSIVVLDSGAGTPTAINLTNGTALPIAGISGLGAGVGTALAAAPNGTAGFTTFGTDLPLAGGTLTGELITKASATGTAGFNLPQGVAPTSPTNGDLWTTTGGLYVQISGTTYGPLASGVTWPTNGDILISAGPGVNPTGVIPGAGVLTALAINVGTAGSFVVNGGAGGTPSSLTLTNATSLPITALSGLGTGVSAALNTNTQTSGSVVVFDSVGGTPTSLTLTNAAGLPIAGITGLGVGVSGALGAATNGAGGFTTFGTDLPLAGGTLTGELITVASTTGNAGFSLPQGVAPTAPANGDLWTTPSGLYAQISGATVGPLASGVTWPTVGDIVISPGAAGNPTGIVPGTGVSAALSLAVNGIGGFVTSTQTYRSSIPVTWDSNTTVTGATIPLINPAWVGGGNISSVTYYTSGTGNFTADIEIGGTGITGCSALLVSGSTATTTPCTGAFTSGSQLTMVISAVSGAPVQALVQPNLTHTAN